MKDDKVYAKHITECINKVGDYITSKEEFFNDGKTYDACLRQLQIMAESTTRLSSDFKQNIPEIPWNDIAGFRNILVHDYMGDITPEIVWMVIENRLPELKNLVERALKIGAKK